jgi:hypothetical protein
MEMAMFGLTRSGWIRRLGIGTALVVGLGAVTLLPAAAQTRTLASLSDVPVYVPAPYHPHAATTYYGSALYSSYDGVSPGGAHYWH